MLKVYAGHEIFGIILKFVPYLNYIEISQNGGMVVKNETF